VYVLYVLLMILETQRLYTQAQLITRQCNKDFKLPGTNVTVEKGTLVAVGIPGLHADPRYYPDPDKFDPERFTDEEKAKRPNYTYLPFGDGPRFCIGKYNLN